MKTDMIKKLTIHGYKSIKDLTIDCGQITLLTGENMSGKTAVMEALLLGGCSVEIFDLNTEFSDVHNDRTYEPISIKTINSRGASRRVIFCGDGIVLSPSRTIDTFVYLPLTKTFLRQKNNLYIVDSGISGADSSKGVSLADGETHLPDKMNTWVERITGLSLRHVSSDPTGCYSFQRKENGRFIKRAVSSAGIKRAVKIIYACLASPENAVICIEQPEAFLSEAAQSELAKFLYNIAQSGRQLFIETHSENIFNALRVGITKKEISAESISVNYLVFDRKTSATKCNPVKINRYGDLQGMNDTMTLDGFFDQQMKDLDIMLGLK